MNFLLLSLFLSTFTTLISAHALPYIHWNKAASTTEFQANLTLDTIYKLTDGFATVGIPEANMIAAVIDALVHTEGTGSCEALDGCAKIISESGASETVEEGACVPFDGAEGSKGVVVGKCFCSFWT